MSFNHESVAALPVVGNKHPDLLRALLIRRIAYPLTAGETNTEFVSVDPDTGTQPLYLIKHGTLFQLDPDDSTTADDDATCLVTASGKRYKSDEIGYPFSVLSRMTAQPTSPAPAIGDTYLLNTAATGTDWAGNAGKVGRFTAAGWRFAIVAIGRPLYVEDETAFYHRNPLGTWTAGLGSIILSDNSVPISKLIGAGKSFTLKIENQTTNAPPGSAAVGVAYIIGSSPSGAWAGNPGKLAICEVANTFTIYTPEVGDVVHNKALGYKVEWNGTAWVPASGNIIAFRPSAFSASGGVLTSFGASTAPYGFNATTAPSKAANFGSAVTTPITHTAKSTSNKLFIRASGAIETSTTTNPWWAIFRDTAQAAIDWKQISSLAGEAFEVTFMLTPTDTLSHDYYFGVGRASGETPNLQRFEWSLEERVGS